MSNVPNPIPQPSSTGGSSRRTPNNRIQGQCRQYARGLCRYGASCKFRHEADPTSENHPAPPILDFPGMGVEKRPAYPVTFNREATKPYVSRSRNIVFAPKNPCFVWRRTGSCPKGDTCEYLHDPKVKQDLEAAAEMKRLEELETLKYQRAEMSKQEASIIHQGVVHAFIVVTYGAGMVIQDILTGFEACRIRIKNIPPDASPAEVKDLFAQQGLNPAHLYITYLNQDHANHTQVAEIVCHQDARIIALGLEGIEFRENNISFEVLDLGGETNGNTAPNILTVSWTLPQTSYIITYLFDNEAQIKARELDKKLCGGRRAKVESYTKNPFARNQIVIRGLDASITNDQVWSFVGRSQSSITSTTENSHTPSIVPSYLSRLLPSVSRIEDFPALPEAEGKSLRLHFSSPQDAKTAYDALSNQTFPWIGSQKFRLDLPDGHKYHLRIPRRQYIVQKPQWLALQASHPPSKMDCRLKVIPQDSCYMLLIQGTDKKAVGALKVQAERLESGEKLGVWHPFFASSAAIQFFVRVGRETNTFIRSDCNTRVLKVCGDATNLKRALPLLQEEVKRREGQERVVRLKRESVRFFICRGFKIMQEELGDENVKFNVSARPATVTIRGGEPARHLLDRLIQESLDKLSVIESEAVTESCPICYDNVTSPFRLGCDHAYCTACLQHFLSTAADSTRFPLVCLGNEDTCGVPIPIPTIQRFLSPPKFQFLVEAALDAYITGRPQEYKFCSTPDCGQIYPATDNEQGQIVTCPACFKEICSSCHAEGHDGMDCEEKRLYSDPAAQERATEAFALEQGFKKCPSCRIWVEKMEGCNHMECSRCRTHFCWICLGVFNADTIYGHMNQAHGGIYGQPQAVRVAAGVNPRVDDYAVQGRLLREAAARRAHELHVAEMRIQQERERHAQQNQGVTQVHEERVPPALPPRRNAPPYEERVLPALPPRRNEPRRGGGWGCVIC